MKKALCHLTDSVPGAGLDDEAEEADGEDEEGDQLPVVNPLNMHPEPPDCPGHHIFTLIPLTGMIPVLVLET